MGAHHVSCASELKRGDHVLYQVTTSHFRQMHYSALVKTVDTHKGKVKVLMNSSDGVVEREFSLDKFSEKNLHRIEYSCQLDIETSISMAEKRASYNENRYHSLHNNSHHFVSFCKTSQEYPLTEILKDIQRIRG